MLSELTSADTVRAAVAEYDAVGRATFLAKYRFEKAKTYSLQIGDRLYDSKAIVGAAFGY